MGSNAWDVATADALDVSTDELDELRRRLRTAGQGGAGAAVVGSRLGVSENEIVKLRRVLKISGQGSEPLVRATVRTILSDYSKTVGGTVFVVRGSEVFHLTVSCEFARDARRSQMAESTAKKRGLRVCKHCKNEADAPGLAPISESSAFADAPDAPVSAKNSTKATKKATKDQRDTAEATRLGLTVAQLKAQRRAAAAHDLRLSVRARAMGVTTKQLRKLIQEGSVQMED